jgi:hypothetical protein
LKRRSFLAAGLCLALQVHAARVEVGRFSAGSLGGWTQRKFAGETQYRLRPDGPRVALHARSEGTASGLYRELKVDLAASPVLHWSWRVDRPIDGVNERSRAGDDYGARVYVVFARGPLPWQMRAINYVWSSREPAGSVWPNAFTSNAWMVAVRSGSRDADRWQYETRDVLTDYRRLFGEDPPEVSAVAIMTDTDNTQLAAEAWYGDIWFAGE